MKLAKKPDDLEKKSVKQLKKFYKTYEELASCSMTWMSSLHLLMEYFIENHRDAPEKLPPKVQYAIAMGLHHYNILGMMIRGDIKPSGFDFSFMPLEKGAWEGAKLEERHILIVKQLYQQLQEAGKI